MGIIHGFLGVDKNRIEMLFVDDASRGKGIGKMLLQYAIAEFGVNEVDVNEQNPQGVAFYRLQRERALSLSTQPHMQQWKRIPLPIQFRAPDLLKPHMTIKRHPLRISAGGGVLSSYGV